MFVFTRLAFLWVIFQLNYADEDKRSFVTCDLDLPEEALRYLPNECQGLDEASKEKLKQEAGTFKIFNEKLIDYEAGLGADSEDEIYKDWTFRAELYDRAELHRCLNESETLGNYLDCLIAKREDMIRLIDDKVSRN